MPIHIIHHNDLDGICAAAIVSKYYHEKTPARPELIFYETNYNKPAPVENMHRGDIVWIVDFSYPPSEMEKIYWAIAIDSRAPIGDQLTWIDHHKTAAAYPYENLQGQRDFRDRGLSGCELTWLHCFRDRIIPAAVRMIGDYDSWRLQIPDSKVFYEGAKLELLNPLAPMWHAILEDHMTYVKDIISHGRPVSEYRDNYTAMIRKTYGYDTYLAAGYDGSGYSAYAMNLYGFGSQQFGPLFGKYPIVIAYIHDGHRYTVSLYSETVDVGKIATFYGGGGHKGAAGFVCNELPFAPEVETAAMAMKEGVTA